MKLSFMWVDQNLPNYYAITGMRGEPMKVVKLLSNIGYNGIEVMMGNPFAFKPQSLKNILSACKMEVSQLCTGEFFGSFGLSLNDIASERRYKAISWGEKVIQIADEFRCSVNIGRFRGKIWSDGAEKSFKRMIYSLHQLDNMATKLGVALLIEPLRKDVCDNLNTISETISFIEKNNFKSIDAMIDTDHISLNEKSNILRNRSNIKFVHLADTNHFPIGKGIIPFENFFKVLKLIDYDNYMSIEVFCGNDCDVVAVESLNYLKKFLLRTKEGIWVWKN